MINDSYSSNRQQDASEFVLHFLNFLHEIYEATFIAQTPIQRNCAIQLIEYVNCTQCPSNRIETITPEKMLACPPPLNIEEVIRRKFREEVVERRCDRCASDTQSVLIEIEEAPRILIVQINRFSNDLEKKTGKKLKLIRICYCK